MIIDNRCPIGLMEFRTGIPHPGEAVLAEYPLWPASGVALPAGRQPLPVPGELQLQVDP
jgi:hypothetical protein